MTTLEEKLEKKKNEIGLVGIRLNFSRPKDARTGIEEYITQDWREIVIRIKADLDLTPDKQAKSYAEKLKIDNPIETVVADGLYHECGHRELPTETGFGCPFKVEHHDKILDGISKALKVKGKQDQFVSDAEGNQRSLESYMANAFEDVLDNVNARKHTRYAGQVLFWNNAGIENKGRFAEFYEAFVRINLALWGEGTDTKLLRRHYTNSGKVKKAVNEFTGCLKENLGTEKLFHIQQNEELFAGLFNKESWDEMAYRFALATADLLDTKQQELQLGLGSKENPFDKMIKLPGVQEDLAYSRYKEGLGPSEHTNSLLQLDALYRKISRAIPVKTSEYTKAGGVPIAYFGKRNPKEDETIKINRIKGIGFDEEGNLGIKVARHELQYPTTYKVHPRNFPRLKIALLDTSSSMAESPDGSDEVGDKSFIPWGDNSKYHFALKGLYGIDNFLEKQGVAPYVKAEAIVFGDRTKATGKRQLRSEEERKALLRMPDGGTAIDADALTPELGERCFLISVSDGEIANWNSVKNSYKKAIEKADYRHIQIGAKNKFTEDLESWGIPVHYVRGDDDLSRLMIDATAKYYKEGNMHNASGVYEPKRRETK